MSDSEEKSKKRKTEDESSNTSGKIESNSNGKVESNTTFASSFQLCKMRKVTVDEFKGNVLVNIREYYEDKASGQDIYYQESF